MARLNEGNDFKKSYMAPVPEYEQEDEVMQNRIHLRKYLRELFVNRIRLLDKDYANFKKLMNKGDDGGFEKIVPEKPTAPILAGQPIKMANVDNKSEDAFSDEDEETSKKNEWGWNLIIN